MSHQRSQTLTVNRRGLLGALGGGVLVAAGAGLAPRAAKATPEDAGKWVAELTGGKPPTDDPRVALDLPPIAENGNTVPVTVTVDSPMTDGDYVTKIHVVAEGNPNPGLCTFELTPACGKAEVSTRMRLARTQNVVAVAELSDGTVISGRKEVKVTIGGCGG